jgi:hypothetical protein
VTTKRVVLLRQDKLGTNWTSLNAISAKNILTHWFCIVPHALLLLSQVCAHGFATASKWLLLAVASPQLVNGHY